MATSDVGAGVGADSDVSADEIVFIRHDSEDEEECRLRRHQVKVRHSLHVLGHLSTVVQDQSAGDQDVLIRCSDGDLSAHSLILGAMSPLLKNYMVELQTGSLQEPMVVVPALSKHDLALFFAYLYGDGSLLADWEDLSALVRVCDALQVECRDWLEEMCSEPIGEPAEAEPDNGEQVDVVCVEEDDNSSTPVGEDQEGAEGGAEEGAETELTEATVDLLAVEQQHQLQQRKRKRTPSSSPTKRQPRIMSYSLFGRPRKAAKGLEDSGDEEDGDVEVEDADYGEEKAEEEGAAVSFQRQVRGSGDISCRFCPNRYHHTKACNKHMLTVHLDECKANGWFHPCRICNMAFTSEAGRFKHVQRLHRDEAKKGMQAEGEEGGEEGKNIQMLLTCPFKHAGDTVVEDVNPDPVHTFQRVVDLKQHVREHHPDKDRSCLACAQDCFTKESLVEHIQLHRYPSPDSRYFFPCDHDQCLRNCVSEYTLMMHKRDAHNASDKAFFCRVCGKEFKNAKFFRNHEQQHLLEKEREEEEAAVKGPDGAGVNAFLCVSEGCGQTFVTKKDLERHERSAHARARAKPFECKECGKTFVDSTRLKQHRWIHAGYLPYKCEQCSQGFRHASHLRQHEARVHGKAKQFQCELCTRQFVYAYQLRSHTNKIHQGQQQQQQQVEQQQQQLQQVQHPQQQAGQEQQLLLQYDNDEQPEQPEQQQMVQTLYQCSLCQQVFDSYPSLQLHCEEHTTGGVGQQPAQRGSVILGLEHSDVYSLAPAREGQPPNERVATAIATPGEDEGEILLQVTTDDNGQYVTQPPPASQQQQQPQQQFVIVYEGGQMTDS